MSGHTARPVHLSTTYHCLCAVTVGSYDRDHLACKARKYLLSRIFIFRKEFAGPWVDTSSRPAASLLVRKQTWGLVPSWRVLQYHGMTSWLTAIFKKKLGSKWHNIKLSSKSEHFSGTQYIHNAVQPSPLFSSRTFLSSQEETHPPQQLLPSPW